MGTTPVSGHQDIFRYKLKTLVPDKKANIADTGDIANAISLACILEYHKKITFVVIAARNKDLVFMKKKQKRGIKQSKKKDITKQMQRMRALKRLRNRRKRNFR